MLNIMIDSGAFSVWKSGKTVDLDAYIRFCSEHRNALFVNLDVIPSLKDKTDEVERRCKESWRNYLRMVGELPRRCVIPVFHQGEPLRWVEKWLSKGCDVLGLSPSNEPGADRKGFLDHVRPVLLDGAGRPVVKVHGFGVGGLRLMYDFPWYSVDSTTWAKHAQVWQFLVPKTRGGKWDYTREPLVIRTSPRGKRKVQGHMHSLSPVLKRTVARYLSDNGVPEGSYVVADCLPGYKRAPGEVWVDATKKAVVRTTVPGVLSDSEWRNRLNARFYLNAAKAAGVSRFYFSAVPDCPDWVEELENVLLSFCHIPEGYEAWL